MNQQTFDLYPRLKRAIQDWLLGKDTTAEIAAIVGVTPSSLRGMLTWWGLSDITECPIEGMDVLDVLCAIILGKLRWK